MSTNQRKVLVGASSLATVALMLSACGGTQASAARATAPAGSKRTAPATGPSASPDNKPLSLTVSGNTPGPIPKGFNPYVLTSGGNLIDAEPMIYESLLQFDDLKPGKIYPWLASSYKLSNGDKTLTFDIRKGVKWTDGKPLTSADVVFSFDLIKKNASLNTNGANFESVKAEGPYKVVFTLAKPDYPQLYDIGVTYIVPKHLWQGVNPVTYTDPNPVGTGPYVIGNFSPQDLVLTKNPHYWQPGKPAVTQLNYPAYDTADSSNRALSDGQETWAGNYIPDVKKTYIAADPQHRHYWFAPLGIVALIPNLTVYPLNKLAVREAISDAIDRHAVSVEGESGYEGPATSPTGLVLPNDNSLMASQYKDLKFSLNDAKAKKLLKSAGFKMKGGYFVDNKGKPISFTIEDPSAYSDYITDAQIISSELKSIGIQVNVKGVSVNAWTSDYTSGNFQTTILFSNEGPGPYYWYDGWLDDSLSAPVGKPATGDYERWHDSATQKYLADYTMGTTNAQRNAGIQGLEGILVHDEPVIPLVYSAVWFEYDDQFVSGWPTKSNPYALGEPAGEEAEIVAVRLTRSK